ncbi:MAG: hypothetical protein JW829_08020, partial [Pirellulales bacterium]|nr:hypothetical protein [Pirellulales bacterium]
ILAEKRVALETAEQLLEQVKTATAPLDPADREFLVRQFEDLVLFARVYRLVAELDVNATLMKRNVALDGLPDRDALDRAAEALRRVRAEWQARYPADPFGLLKLIDDGLSRYPSHDEK